ncbi:hypothetical protein SSCG_05713 [Streptomyces clavuligerus]|nr:hypothetical protein SSCG_05713 [Streptomyces clavuligerus]
MYGGDDEGGLAAVPGPGLDGEVEVVAAGLPASYRPAPAAPPASQEENVMSG